MRDIVAYDDSTSTTETVKHIKYGAFGNIDSVEDGSGTVLPNGADDLHYAYTGREWDQDVQLYYYRARWYDGNTGRFTGEDPSGFGAGDANLFRYVNNNVWNATDPSGLEEVGMHWIVQEFLKTLDDSNSTAAGRRVLKNITSPTGQAQMPALFNHRNDTYYGKFGAVSHVKYNDANKALAKAYVARHGKIDAEKARHLLSRFIKPSLLQSEAKALGLPKQSIRTLINFREGYFNTVGVAEAIVKRDHFLLDRLKSPNQTVVDDARKQVKYMAQYITAVDGGAADAKTLSKLRGRIEKLPGIARYSLGMVDDLLKLRTTDRLAWLKFLSTGAKAHTSRVLSFAKRLFPVYVAYAGFQGVAKGATGNGHHSHLSGIHGAIDEFSYQYMAGPLIEGAARELGEVTAGAIAPPAPGSTRRGLQRGVSIDVPGVLGGSANKDHGQGTVPDKDYGTNSFWRKLE
ncbi:MAG: RHS repeat-associated core domain-containing protein [Fuerstiella sp.]